MDALTPGNYFQIRKISGVVFFPISVISKSESKLIRVRPYFFNKLDEFRLFSTMKHQGGIISPPTIHGIYASTFECNSRGNSCTTSEKSALRNFSNKNR